MRKLTIEKTTDLVSDTLDFIFVQAKTIADTETGDISPEQQERFDKIKTELTCLVMEQVNSNIPTFNKKDFYCVNVENACNILGMSKTDFGENDKVWINSLRHWFFTECNDPKGKYHVLIERTDLISDNMDEIINFMNENYFE